jgi:nitrogen-specific signal transduction histidine kinase
VSQPAAEVKPGIGQPLKDVARLETFGRLAVGASHDFKNLLQVIVGNLYLLETAVAGDALALKRLQIARRAANRGSELIARLLALARRPTESPSAVVDACEVIRGLGTLLERTLGRQTKFEVDTGSETCPVQADASQLESALVNLVINARDAMPHGGKILLTSRSVRIDTDAAVERSIAPGHYVVIQVIDNGQGMSPDVRERALEPFFTTKPPGAGSGLGLAMVSAFVQEACGRLDIDSEAGRGTTVTIHLRRAQREASSSVNDTCMLPGLVMRKGRAVVADADEEVQQVLIEILKTLGFEGIPVSKLAELPAVLGRACGASFLLLDEDFVDSAAAAERVATSVRKTSPDLKILWLVSRSELALSAGSVRLTKPISRGALAQALNEPVRNST